ncbi:MAG: hypothetical protein OEW05_01495 [Candidatus Aminicenantes bacterium]|nr:hypothetical protein [Candidatus Aminicenantes bacterium]
MERDTQAAHHDDDVLAGHLFVGKTVAVGAADINLGVLLEPEEGLRDRPGLPDAKLEQAGPRGGGGQAERRFARPEDGDHGELSRLVPEREGFFHIRDPDLKEFDVRGEIEGTDDPGGFRREGIGLPRARSFHVHLVTSL